MEIGEIRLLTDQQNGTTDHDSEFDDNKDAISSLIAELSHQNSLSQQTFVTDPLSQQYSPLWSSSHPSRYQSDPYRLPSELWMGEEIEDRKPPILLDADGLPGIVVKDSSTSKIDMLSGTEVKRELVTEEKVKISIQKTEYSEFEPGMAAWVKLDRWPWWPARVIPKDDSRIKPAVAETDPVIACVHFLIEDQYSQSGFVARAESGFVNLDRKYTFKGLEVTLRPEREVVKDRAKIKPWVEDVNSTMLKKTLGQLKSKSKSLDLFNQVLTTLEREFGFNVPQMPSQPRPSKKKPNKRSSHKSLSTDSDNAHIDMDMPTNKYDRGKNNKFAKSSSDDSAVEDRLADDTDDDMETEESSVRSRTIFRQQVDQSASNIFTTSNKATAEDRTQRKRLRKSTTDSSPARKRPSRCLESSYGKQEAATVVRTLTWDHNIYEDSCDTDALESLPASQPDHQSCQQDQDDSLTDDNSDDDLPDVLSSASKHHIQKGTLLWVKFFRYPHWPAIVRNCYCKKKILKKITVVFIGDSMEEEAQRGRPYTIRYNTKNVVPFGQDNDRHSQLKEEGLKSQYSVQFKLAVDKVEDFLVKKCLQTASCPFTFFVDDLPHNLMETVEEGSSDSDSEQKQDGDIDQNGANSEEVQSPQNENEMDTSQEEEAAQSDQEELSQKIQDIKERRKERGEKILAVIKSEKVKKLLVKIHKGEHPCDRHTRFMADESLRKKVAIQESGFGPIDDEDQQTELIKLLSLMMQELTGGNLPDMAYIFHVWLPEAIVTALQKTLHKTREVAEQAYLKGPQRSKEEKQLEHRQMVAAGLNISPKDAERYRQKLDHTKQQVLAKMPNR